MPRKTDKDPRFNFLTRDELFLIAASLIICLIIIVTFLPYLLDQSDATMSKVFIIKHTCYIKTKNLLSN
ncbi:hypothetical protein SBF1_7770001 [Candidatus Desulfosporosinus infrequens]|uniref:Uncharacterized protein n=1 Tax=Candidatus Desulfosporosinus infrequens TaxID=2043169 RepID=A0A2U3LRX3_9FIRM|nr:hypothetical protein SBF1_7770001 [Candidatus Desulfosporosinus infrequens]